MSTTETLPAFDAQSHINARATKDLDRTKFAYPLAGNQFGMDVDIPEGGWPSIDEKRMSLVIPFADGKRRDGVGDLLEVGGIDTSRHQLNPICLFDHGKAVQLPIGIAQDPDTGAYTVEIDPVAKVARMNTFFYQGKKALSADTQRFDSTREFDHALFCEQLFDLAAKRYIRAGSIGYQVKAARELYPDYETGVPKGLHLLSTLMLEGSLVVLPANGDTVRKMLAMPQVCGKPLSQYLVKSLTPYAPAAKAVVVSGYGGAMRLAEFRRLWDGEPLDQYDLDAAASALSRTAPEDIEQMAGVADVSGDWHEVYNALKRRVGMKKGFESKAKQVGDCKSLKKRDGGFYVQFENGLELGPFGSEEAAMAVHANESIEFLNEATKAQPSDDIDPEKARQILKDGEAHGKPLTEAQQGMFGAAASRDTKAIRLKYRKKGKPNTGEDVTPGLEDTSVSLPYNSGSQLFTGDKKGFYKDQIANRKRDLKNALADEKEAIKLGDQRDIALCRATVQKAKEALASAERDYKQSRESRDDDIAADVYGDPEEKSMQTKSAKLEMLAAFDRLNRGSYNFVSLVDLRAAVPLSRSDFDRTLNDLRREGILGGAAAEGRHGINKVQQDAMIDGDILYVMRKKSLPDIRRKYREKGFESHPLMARLIDAVRRANPKYDRSQWDNPQHRAEVQQAQQEEIKLARQIAQETGSKFDDVANFASRNKQYPTTNQKRLEVNFFRDRTQARQFADDLGRRGCNVQRFTQDSSGQWLVYWDNAGNCRTDAGELEYADVAGQERGGTRVYRKPKTKAMQPQSFRSYGGSAIRVGDDGKLVNAPKHPNVGETVIARTYLSNKESASYEHGAQTGERLEVLEVIPDGKYNFQIRVRNKKTGVVFVTSPDKVRKSMDEEGIQIKSLSNIRQKYRAPGSVRRRLRKSAPGSSLVYVHGKDMTEFSEEAERKGLKYERLGARGDLEKVKLTGDDTAIDSVAKRFGQVKSMEQSTMSDTVHVKALEANGNGETAAEKWGAQFARRLHEDHSILMKDYDEMLGPLEDEDWRKHVEKHMGYMDKFLSDTEKLFDKKYKDHNYPPLAGAMEDEEETKDLTEDELDDVVDNLEEEATDTEETKDMDTMDDAGNAAASDGGFPEEQVEEDEERIENGQKSLRRRVKGMCAACKEAGNAECTCGKSLNGTAHTKAKKKAGGGSFGPKYNAALEYVTDGASPENATKEERSQAAAIANSGKGMFKGFSSWCRQKGLCPECGSDPCTCAGQVDHKIGPLMAAGIGYAAGQMLGGKDLEKVGEAGGYLGQLSQPDSQFNDEDRMKSYHYHKTLEGMVQLNEAHDSLENNENTVPPPEWEPGAGAKGIKSKSIPCPDCKGKGSTGGPGGGDICKTCNGSGEVKDSDDYPSGKRDYPRTGYSKGIGKVGGKSEGGTCGVGQNPSRDGCTAATGTPNVSQRSDPFDWSTIPNDRQRQIFTRLGINASPNDWHSLPADVRATLQKEGYTAKALTKGIGKVAMAAAKNPKVRGAVAGAVRGGIEGYQNAGKKGVSGGVHTDDEGYQVLDENGDPVEASSSSRKGYKGVGGAAAGATAGGLAGGAIGGPVGAVVGSGLGAMAGDSLTGASKFFKELSTTRDFGDPHREQAGMHAKALNDLVNGVSEEYEESEGPMEETIEPGEMGEKAIPVLLRQYKEQSEQLNGLLATVNKLNGHLVSQ